jgi:hydrogenase maturation protease
MEASAPPKQPGNPRRQTKRILVLGLGNEMLSDDAAGLHVAREMRQPLSDWEGIEVQETSEMGLSLLDYIVGFDDLVLVDAVQTGQAPPGFLHEFDGDEMKALPTMSPHFFGIGEALALGRRLGLSVPCRVKVFAIEVSDPWTVKTCMTPQLQQCLPGIIERILGIVRELEWQPVERREGFL